MKKLTIIFRNNTQITIMRPFDDDDVRSFQASAKTRRTLMYEDLFIDFSEVIFYSINDEEEENHDEELNKLTEGFAYKSPIYTNRETSNG